MPAYPLHFLEYPQNIAAQNLVNVAGAIAAIEQSLRNFWQVGGRIDALRRCAGNPIEIRAQSNVVNPRNFSDVIDMIDQRLQRRARNLGRPLALDAVNLNVGYGLAIRSLLFADKPSPLLPPVSQWPGYALR